LISKVDGGSLMSEKLETPLLSEDRNTSSMQNFRKYRPIMIYGVITLLILGGLSALYYSFIYSKSNTSTSEIISLKNQTAILNDRIHQLEEAIKAVEIPTTEQDHVKQMEDRISTLSQHIEAIQNQPKVDVSSQQAERSQLLEKDINRLAESQNSLKSYILFLRLKAAVLSKSPFRAEFNDFKNNAKDSEALSYIEKYADQGLKMIKMNETQNTIAANDTQSSWWERFRHTIGSFVKIEKVGEKSTPPVQMQELQTVENALEQIEQALLQKLTVTSSSPTPQPGDAL
jgi:hypothetical protein